MSRFYLGNTCLNEKCPLIIRGLNESGERHTGASFTLETYATFEEGLRKIIEIK